MHLDKTHNLVCQVPTQLCDKLRDLLKDINWQDGRYNRSEKTLKKGFVIEMPYAIQAFYQMTPEDEPLRQAAQALVDWINDLDEFKDMEPVRGEIAALLPGVMLERHIDQSWFHANSRRMHVPLFTSGKSWHLAETLNGDAAWHMAPDNLYELNNRIVHTAGNGGTRPRVHLIVDFMPRSYLAQRMAEGINPNARVGPDETCEWNK